VFSYQDISLVCSVLYALVVSVLFCKRREVSSLREILPNPSVTASDNHLFSTAVIMTEVEIRTEFVCNIFVIAKLSSIIGCKRHMYEDNKKRGKWIRAAQLKLETERYSSEKWDDTQNCWQGDIEKKAPVCAEQTAKPATILSKKARQSHLNLTNQLIVKAEEFFVLPESKKISMFAKKW